jgi:hypothetical protein
VCVCVCVRAQWFAQVVIDAHAQTVARRASTLRELRHLARLVTSALAICDALAPSKGMLFELLNTQKLTRVRAIDDLTPYVIEKMLC